MILHIISFQKISREKNKVVDAMATPTSLLQLEKHESRHEFPLEELHHPIYDSEESHVICTLVGSESSHYGAIYSYLHDGIIPETFNRSGMEKPYPKCLLPFPYLW